MPREYAVTAEYYDLLQAREYLGVAERLAERWLGEPRVGVLDAGAGTGLSTVVFAHACDVVVHAIEPAAPMRTVLLSRLAGRPELADRVRVYACGMQELGLTGVADSAWCLNTMASLDRSDRADGLAAIRTALVPDGVLVVQRPPAAMPPASAMLPPWRLGGDLYGADVTCEPVAPGRIRWRFAYRVSRDGKVLREAAEEFDGFLVAAEQFDAEVRAAGFEPFETDEPDIVVARRNP